MNVIDTINFHGMRLDVFGESDAPLFLAAEVAKIIDYSVGHTAHMLETVDENEKVLLNTRYNVSGIGNTRSNSASIQGGNSTSIERGNPKKWFLTEDGLYEVLMQSRKPVAKRFKAVVKRMLKDLRQKGGYSIGHWLGKFDSVEDLDGFNDLRADFGLPTVTDEDAFGARKERWYDRDLAE